RASSARLPSPPWRTTPSLHDALPISALRQGEQHLSDSDLVAFGHLHLGDRPGNRRRHFDGGLVGLELDDRLILLDRVTGFDEHRDRKSTRLNSSHVKISYADFCLKKQ